MPRPGLLVVVLAAAASLGTGSGRAAPAGCTAGTTKALVRSFVASYNAGRVAAIDRLWAPEPYFQWYSTIGPGTRLGSRAYDRATLAAYFRARVRVHEKIVLTELGAGYDARRNLVNFAGKLVRSADDLQATGPKSFKGAAACRSTGPALIVWSM
jgi:hypothetical protein